VNTIRAIDTSAPPAANPAALWDGGVSLAAWRKLGRPVDEHDPRQVREAAAELTSQLFFAPLLAEMRKLPFGRELGTGGRGEQVFGEQLDLRIADAVARRDRGLTSQIADRLEHGSRAVIQRKLRAQRMQAHAALGGHMEVRA